MNPKRILGTVVLICGIGLLFFSHYITEQVDQGKVKIAGAQKSVDQSESLFSNSRVTKELSKPLTGSAQKKINAGKGEVVQYERLAGWLQVGGIICVIGGVVVVIFSYSKKGRSR